MAIPRILALDIGGNPHKWITYEDACYYIAKGLVGWQMGDDDFLLRGGTSAATGQRSTMDINSILAIKGANVNKIKGFHVPPLTNQALFRRDQHTCGYCGFKFRDRELSRDHIKPVSKGGPNIWDNVIAACHPCNKAKDDRTPSQANMPLLLPAYTPTRAEFLILQNKNILPDQFEYLRKKCGSATRIPETHQEYIDLRKNTKE